MRIVSINVGQPREVQSGGKRVTTSIFKAPVAGRVRVRRLNIDGDRQADLRVHGGADKAVYAYPAEHYAFWRGVLGDAVDAWGAFGENFTLEGLLEADTRIGDRLRVGSAEFLVTQPRVPCFKLAIRFGRPDIVKRFLQSRRSGFYLSVAREGELAAGDTVALAARGEHAISVADIVSLYASDGPDPDLMRSASELEALPQGWRDHFRKRLGETDERASDARGSEKR
jgi:MOSC domain-containing protein YiiM